MSKITEARQVEILEEIAENGPDTAKIQAIKLLREIQGVSKPVTEGFAGLYKVEGGKAS
jgi:ERCC4-type nuclease